MSISICFSVVIYHLATNEVERFARFQRVRIERQLQEENTLIGTFQKQNLIPPPPSMDPELVNETKQRFLVMLIIINGSILILSGGLGYILAGKTLKPIHDMLDEQNQFITDASHELRTPLTALKSSLEVNLRDPHLSIPNAKVLLKESITDVNTLQSLSDKLLQLAQYQKPQNSKIYEKINLMECVSKSIQKIEPLAKQKDITILHTVKNIPIKSNMFELIDLLVIFLDNAVKYSPKHSSITIIGERIDESVKISIIDKGIGIAKKDIPHIFDRFFRADSARTTSRTDGYGLGLSIAKKIVDTYKGTIFVTSIPHKGTIFTIQLPIIYKEK